MDPCNHPDVPEVCKVCGAPAPVMFNGIGACMEHINEVFEEAAEPLRRLLAAAEEAFGG